MEVASSSETLVPIRTPFS